MAIAQRGRGFTIIELLAVIATIGILATMIFPVFARARERARAAVCANNLFEIGLALQMYAADWDGRYPPKEDDLAPVARRIGEDYCFRCPSARYAGLTKTDLQRVVKAKHIEYLYPTAQLASSSSGSEQWTPVIADGMLLGADYYYHAGLTNEARGDALLAAEREASHGERAHVLYASGRVKLLPEAEWKKLIPRGAPRRAEDFPSEEESVGQTPGRGGGMRSGRMGRGGPR